MLGFRPVHSISVPSFSLVIVSREVLQQILIFWLIIIQSQNFLTFKSLLWDTSCFKTTIVLGCSGSPRKLKTVFDFPKLQKMGSVKLWLLGTKSPDPEF